MKRLPAILLLTLATACASNGKGAKEPGVPIDKAIQAAHAAVVEKGEQSEATAAAAHYFAQADGRGWKVLVRFGAFGQDAGYAIVSVDEKGDVTGYQKSE